MELQMVQTDTSLMQSASNEIARYMHNQIGLWYISSQWDCLLNI